MIAPLAGLVAAVLGAAVVSVAPTAASSAPAPDTGPLSARVEVIPANPCEYEDGPGPCFWDGGSQGNGQGLSFWIDCHQFTHYLDAEVQAKMDRIVNDPAKRAYDSTCGEAS